MICANAVKVIYETKKKYYMPLYVRANSILPKLDDINHNEWIYEAVARMQTWWLQLLIDRDSETEVTQVIIAGNVFIPKTFQALNGEIDIKIK